MTIQASIVADSINRTDNRLITYLLRYGRQDHPELLTHRAFSRNSGSSRATPFSVTVKHVLDDPFVPEFWGVRSAGMQAPEDVSPEVRAQAERIWERAMQDAIGHAQELYDLGLHKLRPNRLLEPWTHIEVVVSATEWKNWYLLRDDKGAEFHIRKLAGLMRDLERESEPTFRPAAYTHAVDRPPMCKVRHPDELSLNDSELSWHLPFIQRVPEELWRTAGPLEPRIRESCAHCAWTSYGNVEGKDGFTQDDCDATYTKLVGSQPIHASPTEHPAVSCDAPHRHGNFVGWCQWRKFLPGESGGDYLV